MAFSASLILNGKNYTVRSFNWAMQQQADVVGRPDAYVTGGQLEIELDSRPDESLHQWAIDDTKKLSGRLVVYADDKDSVERNSIMFDDAYCVGLSKLFDGSASSQNMTMLLTLSANKLSSTATPLIDNKWPA